MNKIFKGLQRKGAISKKKMKFFLYDYKNFTKLGKSYVLSKIHKKVLNVSEGIVISNCGTPAEKASEFLDHHLKPVMEGSWSYIKDSGEKLTTY